MFAAGGRKLRGFLRRRVRNAADVPDLAQEVYLRLLRLPEAANVANPEAYVFAVAGNLVREHALIAKRAGRAVSPEDPTVEADLSFLPAFEEEADASRQETQLQIALGELSAKCRAAVVMQYRDGLSYGEIAARLGVSTIWSPSIAPRRSVISASDWVLRGNAVTLEEMIDEAVFARATEWWSRQRDSQLSERDRGAFLSWLRESPQHVEAYLAVAAAADGLARACRAWSEGDTSLIEKAASDHGADVITFSQPRNATRSASSRGYGWRTSLVAASLAVVGLSVGVAVARLFVQLATDFPNGTRSAGLLAASRRLGVAAELGFRCGGALFGGRAARHC